MVLNHCFSVYLSMGDKDINKNDFSILDYSHEVRNPLNSIIRMLDMLKDTDLDEDQDSLVRSIQSQNKQLLSTLTNILEYSKLISGHTVAAKEQILIFPFFSKVFHELFQYFRKNKIRLCYFLPEELVGIALIDPILIKQIILYLGEHIVEKGKRYVVELHIHVYDEQLVFEFNYSPTKVEDAVIDRVVAERKGISFVLIDGLVKLVGGEIEFIQHEKLSLLLKLPIVKIPLLKSSIKDKKNQILNHKKIIFYNFSSDVCGYIKRQLMRWGMELDAIEDEFNPTKWKDNDANYQVIAIDISHTRSNDFKIIDKVRQASKLPIILFKDAINDTQKFLALQKDVVVVYKPVSAKDLTLIFEAVFKFEVNELRQIMRQSNTTVSEYKDTLKILIVEDEPMNNHVLSKYFSKLHLKFDIASNRREAIKLYERYRYDLILMDINMPGLDGVETTRILKSLCKEHTPYIIAITADSLKGNRNTYKVESMDDYLFKPVNINELQKKIADYVFQFTHLNQ